MGKVLVCRCEDVTLHELEDDIESHMSRGLTMLSNAVQNQRSGIAECRSMLAALKARDEAMSLHDPTAESDALLTSTPSSSKQQFLLSFGRKTQASHPS